MVTNKWLVRLSLLGTLALLVLWWFVGADWLAKPNTPRAGYVFTGIVLVTMSWHIRAFYRFAKMTRLLRVEERAGIAPMGSVIFALNQRFRYMMRLAEAFVVLGIGIFGILLYYHPKLRTNSSYIRLVLTYFVGSVLLTGFLTLRDLWVINTVKRLSQEGKDDAAALTSVHSGSKKSTEESL